MKTEMSLEKVKFVQALDKKKLPYVVIAGVGLDGKRGRLFTWSCILKDSI